MPTVLDMLGQEPPSWIDGRSLLGNVQEPSLLGREFVVTTMPFANPGDSVHSVDDLRRRLASAPVSTVTVDDWSLPYSVEEGLSELYHRATDADQNTNVISQHEDEAKRIHRLLVEFMGQTGLPDALQRSRLELRL
jgi:arylsulfatase A-like enzyme